MAACLTLGSAAVLPQSVFTSSVGITASAEMVTKGDYKYSLRSDGTTKIMEYLGDKNVETLIVPSTLDDHTVVELGQNTYDSLKELKSIKLPNTLTVMSLCPFNDCPKLETIDIPEGVESILGNAFEYCKGLKTINIPKSVKSISDFAFQKNPNLKAINVNGDNKNYRSVDGVLYDKGKTTVLAIPDSKSNYTIPQEVTTIGGGAFTWPNIKNVYIPKTVTTIDHLAFYACAYVENINVDANNPNYSSYDGMLYNKDGTTLIKCPAQKKTLSFSDTVKTIGRGAFGFNKNITNLILPKTIKTISDYGICSCESLVSVTLPYGLKQIGECAFDCCPQLKNITIPSTVTKIDKDAMGYEDGYKHYGFKIYGVKSSAAEQYAKDNEFEFIEKAEISRLDGTNRFGTAVAISQASYDSSDYVVLASGMNYADALAGVPLANGLKAPILLTQTNEIPDETLKEIERLGAKIVIILGGEAAVGADVEKKLQDKNLYTYRVSGDTRFSTAVEIARRINPTPSKIVFVYAFDSADALSASTVAALMGAPIVYLSKDGKLDAHTAQYLEWLKREKCVSAAYVIGGTGVISNQMLNEAGNALGVKPKRVAGNNRYETCIAVNEEFKSVLTGNGLCVAKGLDFPDALAGGVFAAKTHSPLFLADGDVLSDKQKNYLSSRKVLSLFIFGGKGAVSDALVREITKVSSK